MIDETTKSLINKELDGTLSEHEKARLQKIYTGNPEAREFRDRLSQMNQLLATVAPQPVPEHLQAHIMNTIRSRQVAKHADASLFTQLVRWFGKLVDRKVVLAFSFGCVLTLGVYALLQGDWQGGMSGEAQKLVGTLIIQPEGETAQTQTIDLAVGHVTGTARFSVTRQNVTAEIALTGSAFGFQAEFSSNDLTVTEVRPGQTAAATLTFSPTSLKLSADGETAFSITFARRSSTTTPLTFSVSSDGAMQREEIVLHPAQ